MEQGKKISNFYFLRVQQDNLALLTMQSNYCSIELLISDVSFQNQPSVVALAPPMLSMRNATIECRQSQYLRHHMLMSKSTSVIAIVTYATKTSVGPKGPQLRHGLILWSYVYYCLSLRIAFTQR